MIWVKPTLNSTPFVNSTANPNLYDESGSYDGGGTLFAADSYDGDTASVPNYTKNTINSTQWSKV